MHERRFRFILELVPTPSKWLRRLLRPLWLLLAIVFVFEGWLWDRLATVGLRVANLIALPALKARLAAAIERLPPAATLVVFLVPVLVLLPSSCWACGCWRGGHGWARWACSPAPRW
jgi:hypothetical protein